MLDRLLKPERMVCDCYNIKVSDIMAEIEKGNTTFDSMVASIRLGVLCSACIEDSKKVINALTNDANSKNDLAKK